MHTIKVGASPARPKRFGRAFGERYADETSTAGSGAGSALQLISEGAIDAERHIANPHAILCEGMIATALPEAVAKSCDTYFLGKLAGSEIGKSSGEVNPTWSQVLNDITELLRNVATGEQSRLWLILTPRGTKYLARLATENAVTTLGWNGGQLMGINVIQSSAQTTNRLTLADASAIIYADDGVEIRQSEQAAVEMDDAPTNASGPSVTATTLVSMFQTNCRALLAERRLAIRVVDTYSVVSMTGAQWGIGSELPGDAIGGEMKLETFELTEAQEEAWEYAWANSVESKLGVPGSRKFHRQRFIENITRAEAEECGAQD